MKIVAQRVSRASVSVEGKVVGEIGRGITLLVGIAEDDTEDIVCKAADKITKLRIFPDEDKDINRSVLDAGGEVLAISQFTLIADTSAGNRPSFIHAAQPEQAEALFDMFVATLQEKGISVATGTFGAYMELSLTNTGPVTIIYER